MILAIAIAAMLALTSQVAKGPNPVSLGELTEHSAKYEGQLVETRIDIYWTEEGTCGAPTGVTFTGCTVAVYYSAGLPEHQYKRLRDVMDEAHVVPAIVQGHVEGAAEPRWGYGKSFQVRFIVDRVVKIGKRRLRVPRSSGDSVLLPVAVGATVLITRPGGEGVRGGTRRVVSVAGYPRVQEGAQVVVTLVAIPDVGSYQEVSLQPAGGKGGRP